MRICHIIEPTSGGSVRVALALVKGLTALGHDLTFIYSPDRAEPSFYETLQALPSVRALPLGMRRAVGLHDLRDAFKLWQMVRKAGPFDIIHLHSSKAGALGRLAGLFWQKAKIVYTPHAFVTMGGESSFIYKIAEMILGRLPGRIIAVSSFEKRHAQEILKIQAKKITIIPNGISLPAIPSRAQARDEMGYGETEFVIGFVGRLTAQKNPSRLLEAFAAAKARLPHLRLEIIGDGPLLTETEKKVRDLGLAAAVRVRGNKPAFAYLPGFDALACASDYEGFPLVFPEALACGVPIVTTPVGGSEECVAAQGTGIVCPSFESKDFAEAFSAMACKTPQESERLRAACLALAQTMTEARMVQKTEAFYRELLS